MSQNTKKVRRHRRTESEKEARPVPVEPLTYHKIDCKSTLCPRKKVHENTEHETSICIGRHCSRCDKSVEGATHENCPEASIVWRS